MRNNLIVGTSDLSRFGTIENWSDKLVALLEQQNQSWLMARKGYDSLADVESKTLEIEGSTYIVQWNPGRLASSSASVDEKSIRERKCFLCPDNLPEGQRGLLYRDDFLILCNPFPIFPEHFTVSHIRHVPQEIQSSFSSFLQLCKDLEAYTLLYNGPKCGASAPDHLHFQAGSKGFLPVEDEYEQLITGLGEKMADSGGLLAFAVKDFLRPFISLECDDAFLLQRAFDLLYRAAQTHAGNDDEPMMNILASFQDGEWRVLIFPRTKHRPSFFFEEGEKRMLVSPAAVDVGGVVTTPMEKDFHNITDEHIVQMFNEVTPSPDAFSDLIRSISSSLSTL